ncbi:hypothetical protein V8E55_002996 [Tylopilus felleus]
MGGSLSIGRTRKVKALGTRSNGVHAVGVSSSNKAASLKRPQRLDEAERAQDQIVQEVEGRRKRVLRDNENVRGRIFLDNEERRDSIPPFQEEGYVSESISESLHDTRPESTRGSEGDTARRRHPEDRSRSYSYSPDRTYRDDYSPPRRRRDDEDEPRDRPRRRRDTPEYEDEPRDGPRRRRDAPEHEDEPRDRPRRRRDSPEYEDEPRGGPRRPRDAPGDDRHRPEREGEEREADPGHRRSSRSRSTSLVLRRDSAPPFRQPIWAPETVHHPPLHRRRRRPRPPPRTPPPRTEEPTPAVPETPRPPLTTDDVPQTPRERTPAPERRPVVRPPGPFLLARVLV